MKDRVVIGLEVHIELNTESKMFCSCLNNSSSNEPNSNICPVCSGCPGSLPVINKQAVEKTVKTGIALNCGIAEISKFDRKNYFYPDLTHGYQISQHENPLCEDGFLEIDGKKIRIRRIHLEEDAGKLIHPENENYSLVDFNRAGTALMELVTEPDIKSPEQARKFVEELRIFLRYLKVSNADMDKGELRVDANISISSTPGKIDGKRVEIKNINSFKSIEKALNYEIQRQEELINSEEEIRQETRGWDEKKEITVSQRNKEESHDYRYFPEPDLPAIVFSEKEKSFLNLQKTRQSIPELPQQKRDRLKKEYNLTDKETEVFIEDTALCSYYEKIMSELRCWVKEVSFKTKIEDKEYFELARTALNYVLTDLKGLLKKDEKIDSCFNITPENFAELICLVYRKEVSKNIAKKVLEEMYLNGGDPSNIVSSKNWNEINDESEILSIVEAVIKNNEKAVADYRKGKQESLKFLVGQVMGKTKGTANHVLVQKTIKDSFLN